MESEVMDRAPAPAQQSNKRNGINKVRIQFMVFIQPTDYDPPSSTEEIPFDMVPILQAGEPVVLHVMRSGEQ